MGLSAAQEAILGANRGLSTPLLAKEGIGFVVARVWDGDRSVERKLKGYHSGVKLCPICQGAYNDDAEKREP